MTPPDPITTPTDDALGAAIDPGDPPAAAGAAPDGQALDEVVMDGRFLAIDQSGNITTWSPPAQQVFGWERSEVAGEPLVEHVLAPESRTEAGGHVSALLEGGEARQLGAVAVDNEGRTFPVQLTLVPITLRAGYAVNALLQDLTKQTRTAESVKRIRRKHSDVLASIAGALSRGPLQGDERAVGVLVLFEARGVVPRQEEPEAPASAGEPDVAGEVASNGALEEARRSADEARREAWEHNKRADQAVAELEAARAELAKAKEELETGTGSGSDEDLAEARRQAEKLSAELESTRTELEAARGEAAERAEQIEQSGEQQAELATLREALEARDGELVEVRAALESREGDLEQLSELRAALDAREGELAEARSASESRELELSEVRASLESREAELSELRASLGSGESELNALRESLEARDAELAQLSGLRAELEARDGELAEVRAALESREGELEQLSELRGALDAREGELAEARSALESREAELSEARASLESRDAELAELAEVRSTAEAREAELSEVRAALDAGQGELAEARSVSESREAELSEVRASLESREAELSEVRASLESREAELAELRASLGSGESELNALRESLESRDGELGDLRDRLRGAETELSETRAAGQSHEAEIAELRSALESHEAEASELRATVEARESELSNLRSASESGDAELGQLRETLAERESRLAEWEAGAQERQAELDRLATAARESHARAEELEQAAHQREAQVQELAARVEARETELEELRSGTESSEAEVAELRAHVRTSESELERLRESAAAAESALEEARAAGTDRDGELHAATAALASREAEFEEATKALAAREAELESMRGELDAVRSELESAKAGADHATGEADQTRQIVEEARREADELRARAEEAERALAEREEADEARAKAIAVASSEQAADADLDPITGLFNRRHFEEELSRKIAEAAHHGGRGAAVLLGLNDFDTIEGGLPPEAGEELLRTVAEALREHLRTTDMLARLSGDEFAVLLPDADADTARSVADEIVQAIGPQLITVGDQSVRITLTAGVALFDEREHHAEPVVIDAGAEDASSDSVIESEPGMSLAPVDTAPVSAQRVHQALEEDTFVLYCQPVVDLRSNDVTQYELLLRMADDEGNLILPRAFLETAEESGLIRSIDQWVVRRALRLIAESSQAGKPVTLAVNISGGSMLDPDLPAALEQELIATAVDPRQLILEVSEKVAVAHHDVVKDIAKRVRGLGCKFAVDDFGSSLTSVRYIKDLPLDYLKLDGDLSATLPESRTDQLVIKAIVDIARGMGCQTIAEMVSDDETLFLLRQQGVDFAQGYQVGRPQPVGDLQVGA